MQQLKKVNYFLRDLLPSPLEVLNQLNFKFTKPNKAGYFSLICPSHKDGFERHPSLNLHHASGHFKCHACGAKGGNILDFYILVTGKNFKEAAKDLGAWRMNNE